MNHEENFESVPCFICGNDNLQIVSKRGQFGLPCYVSVCPSDGLVFLSPRWSNKRYKYFYQNEYDSYYRPQVFTDEPDVLKYRNIETIASRLERLNLMEGRVSVLDIGAGMGWSLHWLKQNYKFQELAAIESSEYCIANLKGVVGANVISNDIDADWKSSGFDLIIMRHVFEHVMNPIEVLRKIGENLSSNGIVYIAVPDMMNPKGSLKNYWFRSVHTFYFSDKILALIAEIANLHPIEIKSQNSELWGFFKKGEGSKRRQNRVNVYDEQIRVIKDHQRKTILLDAKYRITKTLSYLLPGRTTSRLKNQLYRLKR